MTTYQLTIANTTLRFRPRNVMLVGTALVVAIGLMSAYVGALRDSVQRGTELRLSQQTMPTRAGAALHLTSQRAPAVRRLVALER